MAPMQPRWGPIHPYVLHRAVPRPKRVLEVASGKELKRRWPEVVGTETGGQARP